MYWLINANNHIEKEIRENEQIEEGFKNGFDLLMIDREKRKCVIFKSGDAPVK